MSLACSSHLPSSFHHRAFAVAIALNAAFVALEFCAGLLAGSVALVADAAHNLGDVLALLVAWAGYKLSFTRPTDRFTYGFGRFSIYAAFFNGLMLVAAAVWIFVEAAGRLTHPTPPESWVVGAVALCGIFVNGFSAFLLSRGATDLNRRAAVLHLLGDAAVSAGVVVSAVVMAMTGWAWVDPGFAIVVAALILWSGWPVLREGAILAMDGVPKGLDRGKIYDFLKNNNDLKNIYDLHIWALGTTKTALTAHLEAAAHVTDTDRLQRALHRALKVNFGLSHVTIQLEKEHASCLDQHEDKAAE